MAIEHKVGRALRAVLLAAACAAAAAQAAVAQIPPAPLVPPPQASPCAEVGEASRNAAALTNTARALRDSKRIKILAIGSTPLNIQEQRRGSYALVESYLESHYKGLDVEVIDRGVSGELARDGFERLQTEVALITPDLVFWQVGVSDAIARTPPDEFKATLVQTIRWLKDHKTDIVLIGMRYVRSIAKDSHYQALRKAIRDVQREEGILRVGHYEAVEAMDRIRSQKGDPQNEIDLTDAGSSCLADFLSRALAAKLFVRDRPQPNGPTPPTPANQPPGLPGLPKPN